jgi:hypothetical protein
MLRITESRIKDNLRARSVLGKRDGRAFSGGVSARCKDHTIPAFWRCFSKRPPEQLVANPSGGRMHGRTVLRRVLVVFVEQRRCVVRIQ